MLDKNRTLETLFDLPKDTWKNLVRIEKVGSALRSASLYSHMFADVGVIATIYKNFLDLPQSRIESVIQYMWNIYVPVHVYFTFPALLVSYLMFRYLKK